MNIEEIKARLKNLQNGKVEERHEAMELVTQYLMNYSNDVTYLLSIIELADEALGKIAYSENIGAMNSIADEALQAIRGK